ncbi:MAG TPA: hypothetical protein PLQ97_06370 [Myxococcota bacterium]|nr:hypothetical protein [Myxococcota bacterium]HQK50565.1 hypothetical protein [Myxococcota bacterium]
MVCPACGHEQPEGFECIRCGIVFAKWEEHRRRTAGMPRNRGWSRPLGRTARWSRALVALLVLGLGVLMYLDGVALKSFGPFVALVFFVGTAAYLLVTFRERLSFGRMAIETGVLALAALVLYGTLPEVFSLQKPLYPEAIRELPPDAAREFLGKALAYRDAARRFLETEEVADARQAAELRLALDPAADLDPAFRAMPSGDQALMRGAWMRLRALHPLIEQVGARMGPGSLDGPARLLPGAVLSEVSGQLDRATEELAVAEAEIARREQVFREAGAVDR